MNSECNKMLVQKVIAKQNCTDNSKNFPYNELDTVSFRFVQVFVNLSISEYVK